MDRTVTALVVWLACASASYAQSPDSKAGAPAPQRQQSPAAKALNDASAIKDLEPKIAALRKVVADFPKTPQVNQANTQLLDALIKKGDAPAIADHAKAIVSGADEASKSRLQREVASALLRGEVLLEDAEQYAIGAVDSLPDEKTYLEARKKDAAADQASSAAASGAPGGAGDEQLSTRYRTEKQSTLSTLGQVYAKRGKAGDAEKALREAYLVDRTSAAGASAALKLADYAKAAGRDAEQCDLLEAVALAGRLTPETHADFQAVYKKLHDGSLAGLEEALDARYGKDGPKAPEVARYERTADRSDRLVLAEVFTGSGCPPCVAADLAFESAMDRYGSNELAVLMYHLHVPRPDPMANPYTQSRSAFYAVPGVPTYAIDGTATTGGGAAANALPLFRKSVEPVVDKRLTLKAGASIALKASATWHAVTATVIVAPVESTSAKLRLHLVLAEEQIRYSGENGIRFHPMVVRGMASTGSTRPRPAADGDKPAATPTLPIPTLGFELKPGKGTTFDYTFDLAKVAADGLANLEDLEKNSTRYPNHKFVQKKHEINPNHLLLLAFVQDEDSKEVLQAVRLELK